MARGAGGRILLVRKILVRANHAASYARKDASSVLMLQFAPGKRSRQGLASESAPVPAPLDHIISYAWRAAERLATTVGSLLLSAAGTGKQFETERTSKAKGCYWGEYTSTSCSVRSASTINRCSALDVNSIDQGNNSNVVRRHALPFPPLRGRSRLILRNLSNRKFPASFGVLPTTLTHTGTTWSST